MLPSGAISIQNLRNEVYGGGGATDLATYGQLWFGRSNCSLSEFRGRSWSKTVNIGAFPSFGNTVTATIDTGSIVVASAGRGVGVALSNSAPWSRFNRLELVGGGTVSKSQFSYNSTTGYWEFIIGWSTAGYSTNLYFDKT